MQNPTLAYAALERGGPLVPWQFDRRAPRPGDVAVDVLYCGVCHSDIHSVNHGASRSRWCRAMKLSAA